MAALLSFTAVELAMPLILRVHPTHNRPLAPTFYIGSEGLDTHLVIDGHLLRLRECGEEAGHG
jgi:hypothetical protein